MSIAIRMRAGSVGTVTQASHRSSGQGSWMDVDWRAHQRWLRIQDRWANVCELGSGPPVLFVLVSAAGISIEHQRNDVVLDGLYRTERIGMLLGTQVALRSDALARRPGLRKALLRFVAAHPDRLDARLVAEQVRGTGTPGFLPALDALTSYPIRARLPEIACPTLIVWGRLDRL